MFEGLIVAGIVGGIAAGIAALLYNINNKKRDKGKYIEKKLKPYFLTVKKILESHTSQVCYNELVFYIVNYLYEMRYSDKKYYIRSYGINTDANKHKQQQPTYYSDMKNATGDAYNVWALFIIDRFISKINNINIEYMKDDISKRISLISENYPESFNVLREKEQN